MSINHVAIVLLALALGVPAQAQEGVRYGVKIGLTSAELVTENVEGPLSGGFNAGAFAAAPVHGAVSALASADYYGKGASTGSSTHHVSLLVAPQYRAALGSVSTALYGFAGPRLDVLMGNRDGEADRDGYAGPTSSHDLNATVFGVSAAAGVELTESALGPLLVELRYDLDATPAQSFPEGDWRSRRLSLRLGLSF